MFTDDQISEEDWGGKNQVMKNTGRKTRRGPKSLLEPLTDPLKKVTLLQNFYLLKTGKTSVRTELTCGMDSLFHVYSGLYCDYNLIRDSIDQCGNSCEFSNLIKIGQTAKTENEIYAARNKILESEIPINKIHDCKNGHFEWKCDVNINYLIEHVLCRHYNSFIRKKQCEKCKFNIVKPGVFLDFNMNAWATAEINALNEILFESLRKDKGRCNKCETKYVIKDISFSDVVMIDLQLEQEIKHYSISQLPKSLKLFECNFELAAVIEFIGDPRQVNAIGHYVSHILRKNHQWKRFDNIANSVTNSDVNRIIRPQILFYVKNNKV